MPLHGTGGCGFCRVSVDACAKTQGLLFEAGIAVLASPLAGRGESPRAHLALVALVGRAARRPAKPLEVGLEFLRCCQVSHDLNFWVVLFLLSHVLVVPRLWDSFHFLQQRGTRREGFPFLGNVIRAAEIPTKEHGRVLAGNGFFSF